MSNNDKKQTPTPSSRRDFLKLSCGGLALPSIFTGAAQPHHDVTPPAVRGQEPVVTDIKVHIVKVNQRGNWVFIELGTDRGISGVGEASQGGKLIAAEEKNVLRN